MEYDTIMEVSSTKDSVLLRALIKKEPEWALATGYQIKYVEKIGIQLQRLLSRKISPNTCHKTYCYVYLNHSGKGTSGCNTCNVIYEATCKLCLKMNAKGEKQD